MIQRVLCLLFALVYRRWLHNSWFNNHDRVIKVKGWRTAIVEDKAARRMTISPCFWFFR